MSPLGRAVALLTTFATCAPDHRRPAVDADVASTPTSATLTLAVPSAPTLSPPSFGAPAPATIVPPVPLFERGMMDHAETFGWSRDGSSIGYCFDDGGVEILWCELVTRGGQHERFDDGSRTQKGSVDPTRRAANTARLAKIALAVPRSPAWPYTDITLTWAVTLGRQEPGPPVPGVLRVGGHMKGESPIFHVALSDASAGGYHDRIHPEMISLSPDGEYLGVIAHAFAGEYQDSFPTAVVPVGEFAAHVYNDTGLAHHKRGDFARAAELFKRAAFANPGVALGAYNLACADARLGSPEAEAALTLAVARGGDDARKKAVVDPDFAPVRTTPWFQRLVQP
jgi:hypothetical protein